MATKPPAFQFYVQDFLMGTMTLSNEEVGAYIRLLCFQWDHGFVPDSDEIRMRLMSISRRKSFVLWKRLKTKFAKQVHPDGIRWVNKRLDHERVKQQAYRELQAQKGHRGGRPPTTPKRKPGQSRSKAAVKPRLSRCKALQSSSSSSSSVLKKEPPAASKQHPVETVENRADSTQEPPALTRREPSNANNQRPTGLALAAAVRDRHAGAARGTNHGRSGVEGSNQRPRGEGRISVSDERVSEPRDGRGRAHAPPTSSAATGYPRAVASRPHERAAQEPGTERWLHGDRGDPVDAREFLATMKHNLDAPRVRSLQRRAR